MPTGTPTIPQRAPAPEAAEGRGPTISTGLAAALFFGIALVYFGPAFLPGRHIFGTDYLAGAYPFYQFISDRLSAGELPRWVPHVFGGLPLFANPGSTFYPVHLLFDLVLPVARAFPAVLWFQFGIAGLGMYLLARELGCRSWVALVGGLAFQFTGIIASWVYAGHDGRIIVATLGPLFFFFLHAGIRTLGLAWFAGAAGTLAFALLSFQIQNAYYLLVAAAIWSIFCLLRRPDRRPALIGRAVAMGLGAVAFGFLLTAVNFLPFLDYIGQSTRGQEGGRGYEYAVSFSMPPAELLSLAVPEHHGASVTDPRGEMLFPPYRGANPFKLHTEYVGAFVIVLLAVGFGLARRDPYWWFFVGLSAFFLTIALGGHTPLYRLYYAVLPGTRLFRAPSLAFFIVAMSLVVLASLALERVAQMVTQPRPGRRGAPGPAGELVRLPWIVGGVVGVALLGMLLTAGAPAGVPGAPSVAAGWGRFALFAGLIGGALVLWARQRLATGAAIVALALLTTADLWTISRRFFQTVPPPEEMLAPDDVVSFLRRQPGPFRFWSFPLPSPWGGAGAYGGNYPMLHGLEQVGGEHPNPLQPWVEYVGAGTQMYIEWQNLIRDPRIVETAEGQAVAFDPIPGFLDAANIRYVVSMVPLAHPSLREVHRGSALVYENDDALPRAFLVPNVVRVPEGGALTAMRAGDWDPRVTAFLSADEGLVLPRGGPIDGEVRIVEHTPEEMLLRARTDRRALLVVAETHYPGWRAEVNGREVPVLRVNHAFRGVLLDAGDQEVRLTFRPRDLYLGFLIYAAGFALLAAYAVFLGVRARRARPAAPG
jgi:hypothetical protein